MKTLTALVAIVGSMAGLMHGVAPVAFAHMVAALQALLASL